MPEAPPPQNLPRSVVGRWVRRLAPLAVVMGLLLIVVALPRASTDVDVDADTSLAEVLSYAHQHGLQFGTDLVFTYGPLGYLVFFFYAPYAAGAKLVASVLLALAVSVGLCRISWRLPLLWRGALLAVFAFVAANVDSRLDLLVDCGLLSWGLLCFLEDRGRLRLALALFAATCVFGSLVKVSMAFVAAPSLLLVAADLCLRREGRLGLALLAGAGAGLALGWVAAGQYLTNLPKYLANGLTFAHAYNAALGREALSQANLSGGVTLALGVAALVVRILIWQPREEPAMASGGPVRLANLSWRSNSRRALLLVWLGFLLFQSWKHGFVCGDPFHLVYFFGFVPVLALALEALPAQHGALRLGARVMQLGCGLLAPITLQTMLFPPARVSLAEPFRALVYHTRSLLAPTNYERQMDAVVEANRQATDLPVFRSLIGRRPVDVFGHQQLYALLNGLNYRPRPVFQSYAACGAELGRLNEAFYQSPAAPDFVIFTLGGFARRFPALQDALALRALLVNYQPRAAEKGFLLLERKPAQTSPSRLLREGVAHVGERIPLPSSSAEVLWLEIEMDLTWAGKLRQLLYQSPTVRLAAWANGEKPLLARRRAPAEMLAGGFIASPLLMRTEDVAAYYDGATGIRPASYSVEVMAGDERFWKREVRFKVFAITPASGTAGSDGR